MAKITSKGIESAIASFTTNADKLKNQGHVICMMIFQHAAPEAVGDDCNGTGDCTKLPGFLKALPRGWADGVKAWFKEFTPIRVSSDGETAAYDNKYSKIKAGKDKTKEQVEEERLKWWKLEDANTTPFHVMKGNQSDGVTKVLSYDDLIKMLPQLAKRIETKLADGEVSPEDELTAKVFIDKLRSIEIEKIVPSEASNDDQNVIDAMKRASNA